ncbi:MAG: hypothetical protein ABI604_08750 [Nitrospirota bacterium]
MNSGLNDANVAVFRFSEKLANRGTLARFQLLKNMPTRKEVILIVHPKTGTKKPIDHKSPIVRWLWINLWGARHDRKDVSGNVEWWHDSLTAVLQSCSSLMVRGRLEDPVNEYNSADCIFATVSELPVFILEVFNLWLKCG